MSTLLSRLVSFQQGHRNAGPPYHEYGTVPLSVTVNISSFSTMHKAIRRPIDTIAVFGEHVIDSWHLSPARLTDAHEGTFQTTISEEPLLYAACLKRSSLTNVKCYKTLNCYNIRRSKPMRGRGMKK